MSLTVAPSWRQQFFDDNGNPLAGGSLSFYVSGTSTPQDTFTTAAGNVANTNPIILDAAGRTPYGIFFAASSYKITVKDANGSVILGASQDGVASTSLAASSVGATFFNFGGEQEALVTNTTYLTGTAYAACHPDTSLMVLDSASLVGTLALSGMLIGTAGVTITAALVNLTDGQPDLPMVSITSSSATAVLQTSGAISFPSGGAVKTYAIKTKVSSGTGFAWGLKLQKTA